MWSSDAAPPRRRALIAAGAGAASAALAGCGFQLRGAAQLPYRTIWLSVGAASPLGAELRRQLRANGAEVVERPEAAEARFEVLQEVRDREILAFSSTGRPREYQIRLRLGFRLHDGRGRDFIAPTEITLRRDVSTNDLQVASRAEEEAFLYRDMQSDMVQQLLRRIAAAPRA